MMEYRDMMTADFDACAKALHKKVGSTARSRTVVTARRLPGPAAQRNGAIP